MALWAYAAPGAGGDAALRLATYNVELTRKGPGLLLRDILRGNDPQVQAVITMIAHADPDILVLQGVDYDAGGATLAALADALARAGTPYPHRFAARPNTGMETGLDIDGDGRRGPRDRQGYGRFAGAGGIAVLSRHPIDRENWRDFSALLWADLPDSAIPASLPPQVRATLRLSTVAHWDLPVALPDGTRLHLFTFHATPPVFDGPEDRNGHRNGDEIALWSQLLDGAFGPVPDRFVVIGDANNDPAHGEGQKPPLARLLHAPQLQDPHPSGAMGTATVDWSNVGLPPMRVSYILPDRAWDIADAGVLWPPAGDLLAPIARAASRHAIVWVDLVVP